MRPGAPVASRRVARALLDVAEKKDDAGRVQAGLREVVAALQAHPELRSALGHPALSPERRKKLAATVFASAPALVREFVDLLVARDLTALLPQVEQSFTSQWNARRGVVSAEVVTAVPADPDLLRALEEAIRRSTGLAAELRAETDAAVLGGVLLRMGGRTYDGTVRGRLQALRRALYGEIRS